MTKVAFHTNIPFFDRDSFLTPFDKMFDQMVESQFPDWGHPNEKSNKLWFEILTNYAEENTLW